MPSRDTDLASHGELCALYVHPDAWGGGIGVALVSAARQELVEQGFRHGIVWALAGNVRADRFYRNDGWVPEGTQRTDTVWGVSVKEFRYQRDLKISL